MGKFKMINRIMRNIFMPNKYLYMCKLIDNIDENSDDRQPYRGPSGSNKYEMIMNYQIKLPKRSEKGS